MVQHIWLTQFLCHCSERAEASEGDYTCRYRTVRFVAAASALITVQLVWLTRTSYVTAAEQRKLQYNRKRVATPKGTELLDLLQQPDH